MRLVVQGLPAKVRASGWRTSRSFSASVTSWNKAADNKAYSATLNLPKTSFPLRAIREKSEIPFQERTCDELYRWQSENAKGPLWVLHDGPPYANGDLHMGHALNKILKDIINRFHLSQGRRVNYIPGWDCHGLPIENKALQELRADSRSLPPAEIRKAAESVAKREIASQMKQFHHFGILADWSKESTYRTLDHDYEMRQLKIFRKMVEKGLIYRHYRPVHYLPSSQSALAEAELVYKDDHRSLSVYVTFTVDPAAAQPESIQQLVKTYENVRMLVWTTTPWTLTANMGIAAHDDLAYLAIKRDADPKTILLLAKDRLEALQDVVGPCEVVQEIQGVDLIGTSYRPIFSSLLDETTKPLKVISAPHVTSESGSGLVHCAPAHGAEDYLAFQALGLLSNSEKMLCHVDGDGKFSSAVAKVVGTAAAENLVGKEVLGSGSSSIGDGTKQIVELLQSMNVLLHSHVLKHRYPYDWKTDKPIIVTATSQWFADLAPIKEDALKSLGDVQFYPAISRNRLESFVRSRSEWCISRQRVWGVPIPALHRLGSDDTVLDALSLEHILSVLEEKGVAHWWNGPVEDFIPPHLKTDKLASEVYRKGTDTMDVWFDSGSSWSMLRCDGVKDGKAGERPFLADVCLEGSDQHRGWFQSQLLTAVGSATSSSESISPYSTLITHGMVLDEKGKKMSKSLGNIVSPLTIVLGGKDQKQDPAYGADVLRLWVATVEYWRDMSIGPTVLAQVAESMRKIRNSARFILANIGDQPGREKLAPVRKEDLGLAERYVMHELYTLEQAAREGYVTYNFPKVVNAVSNFANITLSSLYFDITKDCLYADGIASKERQSVINVLGQTLETMTSVIAPILPHLAEEIHATWKPNQTSFFASPWQPLAPEWHDPQVAEEMANLLRVRGTVLSLLEKARKDKHLKSSLEGVVDIIIPESAQNNQLIQLLRREEKFLKTLFITSDAVVTDEGSLGVNSPAWVYTETVEIPDYEEDLAVRVRPAEYMKCPRCWTFARQEAHDLCHRCDTVIKG